LIANIEDAIAKSIGKINPTLDELLDLYVKEGLYDLTREQAITSMLRNFLVTNPDMVPILGNSLLTAFDAFGGYYPQTTNQEIFSTVYKGYGIVLDGKKMLDGNKYYVIIKQVFEESPADKAGLKVGDEIIKVGGINVEGFGVGAVSNLLAVQPDKAGITVKRGVKNIDISVTRGTVYIQSISFSADDATKTATITIADFVDEYMLYDLFFVMMFLIENEYKNIIFDLRDNPGGNKWNMLEILNAFVPEKGAVIYSEIDKKGKTEKIESLGDGIEFDKICILTNSHSASASEVFALSLRELTGAVIIGEKTFGKGIGQLYTSLSNGDVAAITVFEVLSAKGTRYHKKGVEPDIKILPEYIDAENRTFSQLNFVNCLYVRKGADNKAVLALNQRLARIGYISPEDITSKCTDKTITAVEILQKYNKLPVGISKIDYKFIECLNYYLKYAPLRYEDGDVQYECAKIYIEQGREAAEDYAAESAKKAAEKNAENDEKPAA
jgi:carboxyl-terminal processing protease